MSIQPHSLTRHRLVLQCKARAPHGAAVSRWLLKASTHLLYSLVVGVRSLSLSRSLSRSRSLSLSRLEPEYSQWLLLELLVPLSTVVTQGVWDVEMGG